MLSKKLLIIFSNFFFLFKSTILSVNNENNFILGWLCSSLHDRPNSKAHYRLCATIFHQWLHEYCPLKRLWLVGVAFFFDGITQIIVQRCQIAAPTWPNDISSADVNAIFKNRAENIEFSFGC